jgi:hypothetical protein
VAGRLTGGRVTGIERGGDAATTRRLEPQSGASVYAGEQVTRGKHEVNSESNSGTAGLIVRKSGATSGRFVLTCAHVLGPAALGEGQQLIEANAVYAPHLCTVLGCEYDHPIGTVVASTLPGGPGVGVQAKITIAEADYAVDAALIELGADAAATNEVPGIGVLTDPPRDLIGEWGLSAASPLSLSPSQQLEVRKYGATSGLTHGKLVALYREDIVGPTGAKLNPPQTGLSLVVEAVLGPGQAMPTATYKLDMARYEANPLARPPQQVAALLNPAGSTPVATLGGTADAPTLTITGLNFSRKGDSGAPVVDENGKVIGILMSGDVQAIFVVNTPEPVDIYTPRSHVVFIRAALEFLGAKILPPGVPVAGRRVAAPGMLLERGPLPAVDRGVLAMTRSRFERTGPGAELIALGQRHFAEIRDLVHHNRRVMVAWHRYRGPGFVNAFIAAAGRPGWPVPREVAGLRLADTLRVMRDVLSAYASPSLSAAIAARADDLLAIAERVSIEDLLREWSAPRLHLVTARGVPGTAAALVRDAAGTAYLLTAHHVAFGQDGSTGDQVFAVPDREHDPGPADPGPVPVGTVARGQIGRSGDGQSFVDAALVELVRTASHPRWLAEALAALPSRMAVGLSVGAAVTKDGPATGATRGVLLDPGYHDYPVIEGRRFSAPAQLLLGPVDSDLVFCAPGDSGAAVLDEHGDCAGMLWGTNENGAGIATSLPVLLDALGVQLTGAPSGSEVPA